MCVCVCVCIKTTLVVPKVYLISVSGFLKFQLSTMNPRSFESEHY